METSKSGFTRRDFVMAGAAGAAAVGLSGFAGKVFAGEQQPERKNEQGIPLRPLGKTGVDVSILCLGGHHAGQIRDDDEAIRLVRYAIDNGVTFLDNAWEYHRGRSEEIVGRALRDGYRDKAFVMTKVHGRDYESTRSQIEDSLRRLQVETIDLCQAHEIVYRDDPERFFAEDGGIAAFDEARKAGKIRFAGFTGHKTPALLIEMMQTGYNWDTVQMPVNAFDPHYRSFIKYVLPAALEQGIGVLAMKTMAAGFLLRTDVITPETALRYAWSLPVATVVSGMNSMELLKQNIEFARRFKPMTQTEREALVQRTAAVANEGQWEPYKTTTRFDGRYGRSIHGGQPPQI